MRKRKKHANKQPRKRYEDESHYDPKIHTKTKGGYGFGMKRGSKPLEYENSGVNLARVFGWEVPKELEHIKKVIDDRYDK